VPAPAAKPAAPAANGAPPPTAAAPPASRAAAAPTGKVLASPLARKLATDLGVDLRSVQGTGPGGRIVERDVKAVSEGGGQAAALAAVDWHAAEEAPASATATAPRASAATPLPAQLVPERRTEARPAVPLPAGDVVKPLSMMRRTIAARLLESKTTIPHFYLTADVDMDAAMEFREQVAQVHGARLSVNDLVLKACGLAMRRIPEANASFTEEAIIQHARVDIGMAVAIEDGLITPVIRDADKKTIGQIAAEAREMAGRARERKLRPEEFSGATFSVSNLGMMGIRDFAAIINPPEGAILAVGTVRKEPVVKGDKIVVGHRMSITLSCDHRVIDGALGAKVLQAIVGILERPISLAF
jgi:pyruvate dehydrogenase E2 component (dihydrolipoamide acetyltransferase)